MNTLRRALILVTIQLLFFASAYGATTAVSSTNEYQIKAAYLYKFATYIEWPPSAFEQINSPIVIGILGADEVATELGNLNSGQRINGREVELRRLKAGDSFIGIQMLFVGQKESGRLKSVLEPIQTQPVLVVTESANALDAGSVINFLFVDERIRFEISVIHAERSGLKISARLLGVAQKIETGRP